MKARFVGCSAILLPLLVFAPSAQSAEPIRLSVSVAGTNAEITWITLGATLESTTNVAGPWSPVLGATSPFFVPLMDRATFYRLNTALPSFDYLYLPPTFTAAIGDPGSSCDCAAPENPNSTSMPGNAQDNAFGSVLIHTGELVHQAIDLAIPGRGFDSIFARTYRSGMNYSGPLGYGWDFSTNRRLWVDANGNVTRIDGRGRSDRFLNVDGELQPPSGHYLRISRNPDNTFSERDPHGTESGYSAPSSLGIARLTQIRDRNGNQMLFEYNDLGQLTNTVDTLGRSMAYHYDTEGRLTQVEDHIGRTITFTHLGGDLVSVTGPAVTGTPTGNDFPAGKAEIHEYDLDHKLLSITAPNEVAAGGPPRVVAQYDTNPGSLNAGRLVSLRLGGTNLVGVVAGGVLSFDYASLAQIMPGDFTTAVFQTIVTNRSGNVTEYRFNQLGNVLRKRQFTRGIRTGDPAFYETLREYNDDGEITRLVNPEGDSIEYTYDRANPDRLQQGNLLQVRRMPGPRGGDQTEIVTSQTYEPIFNFVATSTDARGNVTTHRYDSRGNRTNTIHRIPSITEDFEYNEPGQITARVLPANDTGHRRRDVTTYYSSGPQTGYVQSQVVDSGGFNLTTGIEYDDVGNVTRVVDGRGNDSINVVNSLNQVVRRLSRAVATSSGPIRYQTDTFYDANGNVIRVEVENRDENGTVVTSNPSFSTTALYDILGNVIKSAQEVEPGHDVITEHAYDANQNLTQTLFGEATAGRQPNNAVRRLYDERDFLLHETRAPGVPEQSTTQSDYNGNGDLVQTTHGIEDTFEPHVTSLDYDGFGRLVRSTDAMGNVTQTRYDANGNGVETFVLGELVDVPGQAGNTGLSQVNTTFDAMDRSEGTDAAFFDTETGANIGDGLATTRTEYAPNSQVIAVTDDNGHRRSNTYDTANRLRAATDPKGNSVVHTYDANGNTIRTDEVEKSDLGDPDQIFTTTNAHDAENRLIRQSDNQTNIVQHAYDSRNNRVLTTDARGNATRYDFDGLNRLVHSVRDMDGNGPANAQPGDGNPDIVTTQAYDDSSRLTAQTDDNGNATKYAYDSQDRPIVTQMADGTFHQIGTGASWDLGQAEFDPSLFVSGYDVHGNRVVSVDANGTRNDSFYDLSDRLVTNLVTRAAGVMGTTYESFQYDGRSRMVRAEDDDSLVSRQYNSLSHVTLETQQLSGASALTVQSTYDALGNQTRLEYAGGRVVEREFDESNRPILVYEGTNPPIAEYFYVGPSRVQERHYGNGTSTFFTYNGIAGTTNPDGDYGVKRISSIVHFSNPFSQAIDQRTYSWDRSGNPTSFQEAVDGDTRSYVYDAANRLSVSIFESDNQTNQYNLDGAGNRTTVLSNSVPGSYGCNSVLPEPADCQVNQYSTTPFDTRSYDPNGNLISIISTNGTISTLVYDFRNRLVQVTNSQTGLTQYQHDVVGRRIGKTESAVTTRFVYSGGTLIEDRDATGAVLATFVSSSGFASRLQMQRGTQKFWFHEDFRKSIVKLTTEAGIVAEDNRFDDWGFPIGEPSDTGNYHHFGGMIYDGEGLYWNGTGTFDCGAGRLINGGGGSEFGSGPPKERDPRDEPPPVIYGEQIDDDNACRVKIQCHWAAAADGIVFSPGYFTGQRHCAIFTRIDDDPKTRVGHHVQGLGGFLWLGTGTGEVREEIFGTDLGFKAIDSNYLDRWDSSRRLALNYLLDEEDVCEMARCLRNEAEAYKAPGPRPYSLLADYTRSKRERHPNSTSFVGAMVRACNVPCPIPGVDVKHEFNDGYIGWHYWARAGQVGRGDWRNISTASD